MTATVWVICGAGRRVGKTYLAQKLCDTLPDAVYAKCGHGKAKVGKPPHFFRTEQELASFLETAAASCEHIVVESNALARRGEGDIVIFVGGVAGRTDLRPDADELRSRSHLRICPGGSSRGWEGILLRRLGDRALSRAVCRLLRAQKRHLITPRTAVRSKVWFVAGDKHVFGGGLAHLLGNVDRFGTLRRAAQAAHMSYRYAWGMIRAAEKHLGKKLILRQRGGAGGGRSTLSAHGRRLLAVFTRLNEDVADFADERFAALYEKEVQHEKQ